MTSEDDASSLYPIISSMISPDPASIGHGRLDDVFSAAVASIHGYGNGISHHQED